MLYFEAQILIIRRIISHVTRWEFIITERSWKLEQCCTHFHSFQERGRENLEGPEKVHCSLAQFHPESMSRIMPGPKYHFLSQSLSHQPLKPLSPIFFGTEAPDSIREGVNTNLCWPLQVLPLRESSLAESADNGSKKDNELSVLIADGKQGGLVGVLGQLTQLGHRG